MHTADDLYLGGFLAGGLQGLTLMPTPGLSTWPPGSGQANPTRQQGVGPMGRITFLNMVPQAPGTAVLAALQGNTAATPLTLAAGTNGIVAGTAPDASGAVIYVLDVPRCLSLTSASNLSAINYTILGYDIYGQPMSQVRAGPNANTVNTTKAFWAIKSITPSGTNASTVSIGTANIFGLNYRLVDIPYITSVKWGTTLAADAGTAVVGDTTNPATTATGDVRGTYAPSSNADNAKRLVIAYHLDGTQCGPNSTQASAIGVAQV